MSKRFFSARLPVVGSVALLILCIVSFMLPFAFRGAKLAIQTMTNNVADWLPSHFTETQDLKEFRRYFVGDQFVVVSGPWCKEGNGAYINLKRKIFEESTDYEKVLKGSKDPLKKEELLAHRKGNELGLMFTGTYHEDWGEGRERWLMGRKGQWYFIDRQGRLFQWEGQNNLIEGSKRTFERTLNGKNKAHGKFVAKFGEPPNDVTGEPNPFYADPQKLCAQPFKNVMSGPDAFAKMAGKNGTLRLGKYDDDDAATLEAEIEAHKRLTGALFGPTPKPTFQWTFDSLLQHVEDKQRLAQLRALPIHRQRFEAFIDEQIKIRFEDDFEKLVEAKNDVKLELWYKMWRALEMPAPPRQTCLVVTLNEPVLSELDRVVGRPLMGKPRGRILELATGECGIAPENLHIGGPPTDNVAIDEEGTSTLLRLVSLSAIIGIGLSYFSFRSIRVTFMLFFVGGVAAISSLSYVWFGGSTLDAILMSMPSLVFVLGLAGAVHVVNYYRDACHEDGPDLAVETAIKHGWFPCTLAAFTTALGLVSLYASTITPIKKFGLFSSIAVMATVVLLFTYLPAALTIWSPGYKKQTRKERLSEGGLTAFVSRMWQRIGEWVIRQWAVVCVVAMLALVVFGYGISRVKTSVHLLKLFDPSAKILQDYKWMEDNFGKLVPAEIVAGFDKDAQREVYIKEQQEKQGSSEDQVYSYDPVEIALRYTMLERMELSYRIRTQLEKIFGPNGLDIVGTGMSTDVFVPLSSETPQQKSIRRNVFNELLNESRAQMLEEQYLAEEGTSTLGGSDTLMADANPENAGRELWRVSIRLAALNNVDYGQFVNDLKSVVEPMLKAYEFRTDILKKMIEVHGPQILEKGKSNKIRFCILGRTPDSMEKELVQRIRERVKGDGSIEGLVDQTYLFSSTLTDLLKNRGFSRFVIVNPNAPNNQKIISNKEDWEKRLASQFDCVVLVEDHELFDLEQLKAHAPLVVDCRKHKFEIDEKTNEPAAGMLTAKERNANGEELAVSAMYTGIIPIVYKAQNQLLKSLINSIALAFVMIAGVMMLLLRDWKSPFSLGNSLNVAGGVISMLPNIFPVVLVFGIMGWTGNLVDIGSMMTASVAMGVAVDDTIHFLSWYRLGLQEGKTRLDSIRSAYDRVATAMTQTTLIGGLGLFAFALSTFTPTQKFGVLMLFLLTAALIGDLIFLPALLASPLGRFFGKERPDAGQNQDAGASGPSPDQDETELKVVSEVTGAPERHPDSLKQIG